MKWKWPLQRRVFELGGKQIEIDVVADPDAVLDDAVKRERDGQPATLPFWASVWPSGIALAEWAIGNVKPGQTVLDLGCGMGLVGAAAIQAGADVTVADIEPDAVELAVRNTGARGIVFDLTTDTLDQHFDWILGGDLLYERAIAEPLLRLLTTHAGQSVLADPMRQSAEAFLGLADFHIEPVAHHVRLIFVDGKAGQKRTPTP